MFSEDLSPFFDQAGFASLATLAGAPVSVIFDSDSIFDRDIITQETSVLSAASDVAAAAPGQTLVLEAVNYTVRQVLREPPDGKLTRLVLARG